MADHEQYEDWQRKNEAEVLAIYQEEVAWGEITAEDCEVLYRNWLLKWRGQPNSLDFKV